MDHGYLTTVTVVYSTQECFLLIAREMCVSQGGKMSDDLKNRGAQDRSRVNVNEAHEIQYWTGALKVSEEQLRQAVKAVGVSADAVREYLGRARTAS